MSDLTKSYKGYQGSVEVDLDDGVCHGKILFISDLVTYQAEAAARLQAEFEAAVDDYLAFCESVGRDPQKAMSGQFNVRVSPDLHKKLALCAKREKVSLNEIVNTACERFVSESGNGSKITVIVTHSLSNVAAEASSYINFLSNSDVETDTQSRH